MTHDVYSAEICMILFCTLFDAITSFKFQLPSVNLMEYNGSLLSRLKKLSKQVGLELSQMPKEKHMPLQRAQASSLVSCLAQAGR